MMAICAKSDWSPNGQRKRRQSPKVSEWSAVDQSEVNGLHGKSGQPELQPLTQNSRWQCHLRECERFQRNAHDESLTGSAGRRRRIRAVVSGR
jgi:hypothetical protein